MNIVECRGLAYDEQNLPIPADKFIYKPSDSSTSRDFFFRRDKSVVTNFFKDQEVIPIIKSTGDPDKTRAVIEGNGGKVLEVLESDEHFQRVNLPDGWMKMPFNNGDVGLFDEQGRERSHISLSESIFGIRPIIEPVCRFSHKEILEVPENGINRHEKFLAIRGVIFDSGEPILKTTPLYYRHRSVYAEEARLRVSTFVETYLEEKHPGYKDPLACWDKK